MSNTGGPNVFKQANMDANIADMDYSMRSTMQAAAVAEIAQPKGLVRKV